jgi:hypothetical protein
MGDFKVCVRVGVCCTKCTLNTGVNTNFEITHCKQLRKHSQTEKQMKKMLEAIIQIPLEGLMMTSVTKGRTQKLPQIFRIVETF